MKKEIAAAWVKELRSGKYNQGREQLVSANDQFCCLGVLCNMAAKKGVGEWEMGKKVKLWFYKAGKTSSNSFLPAEVIKWAGMSHADGDGSWKTENGYHCLSDMNDSGKKFSEIADVIERNWEFL